MNILAIESSAAPASVAVSMDGTIVAQYVQNKGQTHSRTILPMLESLLHNCELTLKDMDVIAVAVGPGSFTGLRIGVSIAKGLAWQGDKQCCGVSTLEAMAHLLAHMEGSLICPVMNARRNQVYNALFEAKNGMPYRLTEDRAISLEQLLEELKEQEKSTMVIGDGAVLCYNYAKERGNTLLLAPEHLRLQTAWGVACAARRLAEEGNLVTAHELTPRYLRLSQAERERLKREQANGQGLK